MIKSSAFSSREKGVFFFAVTVSIILTAWINYHQSVINPDAICYLLSAQEIGKSGIRGGMQLCGQAQWPFYSVLIYSFSTITHLSYLAAAYLLNGFCSLLTVVAFILVVKELGGVKSVLWLAAGVILLDHTLNSVREYIIRDHGFWSFYLISLWLLLRYFHKPHWMTALTWSLSLCVAALFRLEGVVFLVCMPFLAWCHPGFSFKQRLKSFLALNMVSIILAIVGMIWFLFHTELSMATFGRMVEIPYQIQHGFLLMLERFDSMKMALAHHVLAHNAMREVGMILFFIFIAWYLVSIISNLSWIYALLLFYGLWNRAVSFRRQEKLVLFGYIGVNMIVTFAFLLERNFLSKRYLVALSLVLLVWIPFILHYVIQQFFLHSSLLRHRLQLVVIATLMLLTTRGDFFDASHSKAYIQQAGQWIAENVPKEASIYVNDYQLMYYSKRYGNHIFDEFKRISAISMKQNDFNRYDFLALRLNNHVLNNIVLNNIDMSTANAPLQTFLLLQVFRNPRGDRVAIYKVK